MGDTVFDLDHLSLIDWRIIKKVYLSDGMRVPLHEIQNETKYPYHTVRYHCKCLYKFGLLEKERSSYVSYFAPSSKDLQEIVMNRYYDIMEA